MSTLHVCHVPLPGQATFCLVFSSHRYSPTSGGASRGFHFTIRCLVATPLTMRQGYIEPRSASSVSRGSGDDWKNQDFPAPGSPCMTCVSVVKIASYTNDSRYTKLHNHILFVTYLSGMSNAHR